MKREKKDVVDEITRLREVIRKKYTLFKQGQLQTEILLENQYKPLLKELRKPDINVEPKSEPNDAIRFEPFMFSSPNKTVQVKSVDSDFDFEDGEVSNVSRVLNTSEGQETASRFIKNTFSHPLTVKFMTKLMKDVAGMGKVIDNTYGPRFEGDVLMIGDKPLHFDDDGSVVVASTTYKPTEGLYELIFKRIPDEDIYKEEDLQSYKDILNKTSAHKKNYSFQAIINRNTSLKYKHVISKIFPKQAYSGKGLFLKNTMSQPIITYWDDPNELCDRLRLLVLSAEAGNTSHKNEIISIVEELKEAGIIKGSGNLKFLALLQ